jgi:VacB/RNase II family 3'-5' exoribonuclease
MGVEGEMSFDLLAAARRELAERGFAPEFPPDVRDQAASLAPPGPGPEVQDLRDLPWSSIDNDDSRDLDQVEVAERVREGIRVMVGIADVDAAVPRGCPIDRFAAAQTTSIYTGIHVFPMLPERLSTDITSLLEGQDRLAVVTEFTVAPDGSVTTGRVFRALLRNRAQLVYGSVGPWLEGSAAPPPKIAGRAEIEQQVRLQDEASLVLEEARHRLGALSFDRVELRSEVSNGHVKGIAGRRSNRAARLIENFMIAANETMAQVLDGAGVPSIERVVDPPERWPRIVALAAQYGVQLPASPDAASLNRFLLDRRAADPDHYPDVSLGVLKLMGPGEYRALPAGAHGGHFGLATHDYTHSTAPNRRFADIVTQRLIKSSLAGGSQPYTLADLEAIARECTLKEDAARKVQRDMNKRIAAVAMSERAGQDFDAVVTGVVPHKGVFVRLVDPPVEGRLMRGEQGADVGDRIRVRLLRTDPERGFIDFGRES